MRNTAKHINTYLLTGGQSRRFGSDKALYEYQGKPLINYSVNLLSVYFEQLVIIAKDEVPYKDLEYPVIEDLISFQTPLAGIYTGLSHTNTEWNFFLACDMPLMTVEALDKLCDELANIDEEKVIVPKAEHNLQPLAALYHRSLADDFLEIANKIDSVKDFIRSYNHKVVEFENPKPFTNVNTKEQLKRIDR